jgi:UDP-N-acetylmuramoyl-L-alanyl-D-glutamate--2,6-diaminopimelate ligase
MPLMGRFNVSNALAAVSVALARGAALVDATHALASFTNVPGRLERVPNHKGIEIFVDYAHTGESLASVLQTLKETKPKRLFVVFGCGGGRDPNRRTKMGQAAVQYADLVIVTTDNPRHESPEAICRQILAGCALRPEIVSVEYDRAQAIRQAIGEATDGDIVLIAGKGHEKTQTVGSIRYPFDDVAVAKQETF